MLRIFLTAGLGLLGALSSAEKIPGPLPTPLEEFTRLPNANIVIAREAAHIRSGQTQITVTAIVVESGEQPARQMQGIRFELVNEDSTDQVYLDTNGISEVQRDLRHLQWVFDNWPSLMEVGEVVGTTTQGTARCAHPNPIVHTLCPEYYRSPGSSGISLRTMNGQVFLLPGHELEELADALNRGIQLLERVD